MRRDGRVRDGGDTDQRKETERQTCWHTEKGKMRKGGQDKVTENWQRETEAETERN